MILRIIKLLNEVEYDVKNYADLGGCYPPRMKEEMDNILRDLRYSHHTKAEFDNN